MLKHASDEKWHAIGLLQAFFLSGCIDGPIAYLSPGLGCGTC